MSLIQQALKKREEELRQGHGHAAPPTPITPAPVPPPHPPRGSGQLWAALLAVALVAGLSAALSSHWMQRGKSAKAPAPIQTASLNTSAPATPPPPPQVVPAPPSSPAQAPSTQPAPIPTPPAASQPPPTPALNPVSPADELPKPQLIVIPEVDDAPPPPGPAPAAQRSTPEPTGSEPPPSIRVMGVLLNAQREPNAAILNGEVVAVGETLMGARLVEVSANGVRIAYGGTTRFVRIGKRLDD